MQEEYDYCARIELLYKDSKKTAFVPGGTVLQVQTAVDAPMEEEYDYCTTKDNHTIGEGQGSRIR